MLTEYELRKLALKYAIRVLHKKKSTELVIDDRILALAEKFYDFLNEG